MKQEVPITKSISIFFAIILIGMLVLFIAGFYFSGSDEPVVWGAMIYLMCSFLLRYTVPRHHRKGMSFIKQGRYEEAMASFEKSFVYFSRHAWVDTFRVITAFSSSKLSFREIAMVNKAFCLVCLDHKEEARRVYEQCLAEYPKNHIAFFALKALS